MEEGVGGEFGEGLGGEGECVWGARGGGGVNGHDWMEGKRWGGGIERGRRALSLRQCWDETMSLVASKEVCIWQVDDC